MDVEYCQDDLGLTEARWKIELMPEVFSPQPFWDTLRL